MARHKEFDTEAALDGAMNTFWAKGYEATSIQDLVERMEINRGSLYHAFGDKQSLFLAALDRYDRVVTRRMLETLEMEGSGKDAVRRFFLAKLESARAADRPQGCLVTNAAVERSPYDPAAGAKVRACLAQLEAAFHKALVRAREAGEIPAKRDLRALARHLTNSAQGLSVLARAAVGRAVLEDIVRVTLAALD